MNRKTLIAIDPGASGGIAIEHNDGKRHFEPMPETETEIHQILSEVLAASLREHVGAYAVLEQVGGFTGEGQPGSAMFRFGRGVGVIVGLLVAMGIPFIEVRPQAWQSAIGTGTRGTRSKPEWKRHLKDLAQKRNPGAKITLKTADAALMLDYLKAKS